MADHTTKPIKDIKVGDRVIATELRRMSTYTWGSTSNATPIDRPRSIQICGLGSVSSVGTRAPRWSAATPSESGIGV
jgi:hypothetical protein